VTDRPHASVADAAAQPPADFVAWLLAADEPAVRYAALTGLLGEPFEAPEVEVARRAIMTEGAVPRILAAQGDDGHWGAAGQFYRDKYRGTVWQLIVLAELSADPADERVRAACEAILRDSQEPESGGFSTACSNKRGGGQPSGVIPCLTGNMVFSLIRLGMLDDSRLQHAVDWVTTWQRFDDAAGAAPTGGPYDRYKMCWGTHTCHMGVVKALKGLAEMPSERRSPSVERTLAAGTEYLLRHHVHKRSHDLTRDSKPSWKRFGFPLMWQTDALEILLVLAKLGMLAPGSRDERTDEALDLVRSRRGPDGRWKLQTTQNGKVVVDIETRGQPSRWVTLRALQVLKAAGLL
jgi:hypothetical protein